jgi:hypothetical protein
MSKSRGNDQGDGTRRVPTTDPIAAQIEAEIADHLATSAELLEAQGIAAGAARRQTQEKFGDVATIGRRCYWIKQGDTLMFRTAVILLLAGLCLALGFATFSSVRSQRQMAEQMATLAEQLKALAEQQRTVVPTTQPADPKPLEITGKAYIGSPDKPAAYHEIKICKAIDGEIIRRLPTAADGAFSSGPLPAGDYFLMVADASKSPSVQVQSAPILLYPTAAPKIDLDVSYPTGRLAIEISRPLPKFEINGAICDSRVVIKVLKPRLRSKEWTSKSAMPPAWPIFINDVSLPNAPEAASYPRLWFYEVLSNENLESDLRGTLFRGDEGRLPVEECLLSANVVMDIMPVAPPERESKTDGSTRKGPPKPTHPFDRVVMTFASFGPYALRTSGASSSEEYRWTRMYFNRLRETLRSSGVAGGSWTPEQNSLHLEAFSRVEGEDAIQVPIAAASTTRVRIELPDDLESQVRTAYGQTLANPAAGAEAWKDHPMFREVKIIVVGTEPQDEVTANDAPPMVDT